jgi:hypothetical protein
MGIDIIKCKDDAKVTNAYALYVTLTEASVSLFMNNVEAKNKVEIMLDLDGAKKGFTYQEFKRLLGF